MILPMSAELPKLVFLFGFLICSNAFSVGLHSSSLSQHTVRSTSRIFLGLVNPFPDNQDSDSQELSDGIIGIPTKNVLGGFLQACCFQPKTGFYRDGFCQTGPDDDGRHTVCVRVDKAFLDFSKSKGNDLSTPFPNYGFPGLKPDDCWCLCAGRWKEAFLEGKAPPVILSATHEKTLETVTLDQLLMHASGDNTSEDEMQ